MSEAKTTGRSAVPGPVAFVDSSAIVTLIDAGDASHAAAVEAYRSLISSGYRLFTTDHVIVEALELLTAGIGPEAARRWLGKHNLAIYYVDASDMTTAIRMIEKKSPSEALTLADALSMVVMERLGVTDAFAVDPAFLSELN